jgi:hypothetical protein
MRSAVGQAGQAFNNAGSTAATLGGEAQGIGSELTPFLTQEMLHPEGVGQTGLAAETASGLAGAGGAAAGLTGAADERAAVSRNAGGFSAALDDAARQRAKGAAGASEGITANNEQLKQQQVQDAARGLQGMYGTDTSGMLSAMGQQHEDINSEVDANKTGWLQNTLAIVNALKPGYSSSGGFSMGGGGG